MTAPSDELRKTLVSNVLDQMLSSLARGIDVGACEFYDAIMSSDSFPGFKVLILSVQSPDGPKRTEALSKYVLADMLMKEKVRFVATSGRNRFLGQDLDAPDEPLRLTVRVFVQDGNVEFCKERVILDEARG